VELTQSVGLGRTGTRAAMRASTVGSQARLDEGWEWGARPWQPMAAARSSCSPVHTLQLVKQCNEGAHKMERTEQMYTLHTQLDFSKVKVGAPNPAPAQALL